VDDPRDVLIVSDLHLGIAHEANGPADPAANALLRLVRWKIESSVRSARRWRLLLLGDVFDFAGAADASVRSGARGEIEAVAAFRRLVADHPALVEAIDEALAADVPVAIVAGNHDVEWSWPVIQHELRQRVASRPGLTFHPWIFYLPAVLYAEHGNQHHDINALPRPMRPYHDGIATVHVGAALDDYLAGVGRTVAGVGPAGIGEWLRTMRRHPSLAIRAVPNHVALLRRVIGDLVRLAGRAERRERQRYRDVVLPSASTAIGLPVEVLAKLDAIGTVHPATMVRRLARVAASRPQGRGTRFVHRGAHRVHNVLSAHGLGLPVYAFGHTHVAERVRLSTSPDAWYVNSGSWGAGTGGRTIAEVRVEPDGTVTCELLVWDDRRGATQPARSSHGDL
jgi:UDP-2,3-diacylglucosamine pyrophosphatase LpxH